MQARYPPISIITPCYNEGSTVIRFLESLENTLRCLPHTFHVIVVNDCSTDDTQVLLNCFRFNAGNVSLKVIGLDYNAGHQAAIYQGFLYAHPLAGDYFIVMDADGQDTPAAIPELLQHLDVAIVCVLRGKRNEPILFRACYYFYKLAFKAMTGKQMNYGNFCLISRNVMETAIAARFAHFAAFLSKQKVAKHYIVATREKRMGGRSKMGFIKLLRHAISSFAEYWDYRRMPGFRYRH